MAELLGVYDSQIMRHTVIEVVRRGAARRPAVLPVSYGGTTSGYCRPLLLLIMEL